MDSNLIISLMPAIIKAKGEMNIVVTGVSMQPLLLEGDVITIKAENLYTAGDILVYSYKNEGLLVHRLLLHKNDRYFCKGDNAFRLEDIAQKSIIGKVTHCNGMPIKAWGEGKIALSYKLGREFKSLGYSKQKTTGTTTYNIYADLILRKEEAKMTYKKSDRMDFIPADSTSITVFDTKSGDSYIYNETGVDIFACLDTPCSLDTLLLRLSEIYEDDTEDIRNDVEEFLADAIAKGIIEAQ